MPLENPNWVANGNIAPCRFVTPASTAFRVTQATANQPIIGVSQQGLRMAPISLYANDGYAAIAGEALRVYGEGEECLVEAGDTFAAGVDLKADADGKAVPALTTGTTAQNIGGIARQAATAVGQKVRVLVQTNRNKRPAIS